MLYREINVVCSEITQATQLRSVGRKYNFWTLTRRYRKGNYWALQSSYVMFPPPDPPILIFAKISGWVLLRPRKHITTNYAIIKHNQKSDGTVKTLRTRHSKDRGSISIRGKKHFPKASRPNMGITGLLRLEKAASLWISALICIQNRDLKKQEAASPLPPYVCHGVRQSHKRGMRQASHKRVKLRCWQPTLYTDWLTTFILMKSVTQFYRNVQEPESGHTCSTTTLSHRPVIKFNNFILSPGTCMEVLFLLTLLQLSQP